MAFTNEGEQWALQILLQGASNTADLYVGLYTNPTEPAETATMVSGLTEVSTSSTGYARLLLERSSTGWTSITLASGDYQATSKLLTFGTPTDSWGTVNGAFITTVASGTAGLLIATYHFAAGQAISTGSVAPELRIYQKAA